MSHIQDIFHKHNPPGTLSLTSVGPWRETLSRTYNDSEIWNAVSLAFIDWKTDVTDPDRAQFIFALIDFAERHYPEDMKCSGGIPDGVLGEALLKTVRLSTTLQQSRGIAIACTTDPLFSYYKTDRQAQPYDTASKEHEQRRCETSEERGQDIEVMKGWEHIWGYKSSNSHPDEETLDGLERHRRELGIKASHWTIKDMPHVRPGDMPIWSQKALLTTGYRGPIVLVRHPDSGAVDDDSQYASEPASNWRTGEALTETPAGTRVHSGTRVNTRLWM